MHVVLTVRGNFLWIGRETVCVEIRFEVANAAGPVHYFRNIFSGVSKDRTRQSSRIKKLQYDQRMLLLTINRCR